MVPRAPEARPRPCLVRRASSQSKASVASISPSSNEADDEQSLSSAPDPDDMDDHHDDPHDDDHNHNHDHDHDDAPHAPPHYHGEDTRLTSPKELRGFYMYAWAAEVFVVCGIGSFIPVTLEQLARENGVLLSDPSTPCRAARPAARSSTPRPDTGQCIVRILGLDVNTASFAMYTFSISVLVQALLIISMSGAADHGRFRKKFLLAFALVGSIATMLFLPVGPPLYLLGALLAIVANTCFGASFVLLNSFLPLLVRFHPTVYYADGSADVSVVDEAERDQDDTDTIRPATSEADADVTTALLPRDPGPVAPSQQLALATQISSYGIGIGYIAALVVQTIGIFVVIFFHSSNFGLRMVLFIIGAWWLLFTIPAARWLRPRPGPPMRIASHSQTSNLRIALAYFSYSWKSLGRTALHARHLKDVLLFLAAWFLLSDSIATVSGTAVLFAKTTLGMSYAMLALINVIATISGVFGAFFWSRISLYLGLSPTQTILCCILLFEAIPVYGLLGYLPAVQRLGYLGLQQQWEMYPLGAVYGFVLGGLSSYCRALFGELIPPGHEAAFYALYAITDKGSSIFGPAVVGAITDAYGEIRPAFWFLAILIGLPFPIMLLVDVERGRREGIVLAKTLGEGPGRQTRYGDDDDNDGRQDELSEEVRTVLERRFNHSGRRD